MRFVAILLVGFFIFLQKLKAQICTGSLGDPVVNITFGSGSNPGQPLSDIVSGASTTYTFVPVSGNPATPIVYDGQYTITNNIPSHPAWFSGGLNHTPGDANGFMAFFNASEAPGDFYRQTLQGLCENTKYEFAAWIANILNPSALIGVDPDITFVIEKTDGTSLASFATGSIQQHSSMTWEQFGFFFSTPPGVNSVVLKMINTKPGGLAIPGNDLAIDDITFRPCGPALSSSFSSSSANISKNQCGYAPVMLYGSATPGYSSPSYLWQISYNSGALWIDLPSSDDLNYLFTPTSEGSFDFRILSGEASNINSPNCRVASGFITLTINTPPQLSFTGNSICAGQQAQLQFQIEGGASPYSITYSSGYGNTTLNNIAANEIVNVTPAPAVTSTYTILSVTDASGCVRNAGFTTPTANITVKSLAVTINPSASFCKGDSIQLSASGGLSYSWYPSIGLNSPTIQNPKASPDITTTYKVVVNDNGCSNSASTTITVDAKPVLSVGNSTLSVCLKDSTQLMVSGAVNYSWSPSAGLSNPSSANPVATVNSTTTYTVTGMAANGCSATDSVTITALPKPNVAANNDTSICGSGTVQLAASGADKYSWSPAAGLNNALIDQPVASVSSNVKYIVAGTAANGCQSKDSVIIQVLAKPVLILSNDTIVCENKQIQLSALGAQEYQWSPSVGLSSSSVSNPVVNASGPVTYTVTGTAANGCSATSSVSISTKPQPVLSVSKDTSICFNGFAYLAASGAVQYHWFPAQSLSDSTAASPIASPTVPTKYYLSGTGLNGCETTDSVLVNVKPKLQFTVSPAVAVVCSGKTIQFTASGGDSYLWKPAASLSDPNSFNPVAAPVATTVYSVTIKDTYCNIDSTISLPVTVNPNPVISVTKDNDITCSQPFAQLRASGASSYRWINAAGLNDSTIANPIATLNATTTYYVVAASDKGCTAKDSITVKFLNSGNLTALQLPNAFTPNGDGLNDCFGLKAWGNVNIAEFRIYNRWGQVVFNGKSTGDCWDGNYKGMPQHSGAFPYIVKVKTPCGEVERKGMVVLIR